MLTHVDLFSGIKKGRGLVVNNAFDQEEYGKLDRESRHFPAILYLLENAKHPYGPHGVYGQYPRLASPRKIGKRVWKGGAKCRSID